MKTQFLMILALVTCTFPLSAWDKMGHMVVAKIAYDRLTPQARARVDSLVTEVHFGNCTYNAVNIAAWADQIKYAEATEPFAGFYKNWHFIDIGLDPGDPDVIGHAPPMTQKNGTIVEALQDCETVLQNKQPTQFIPNEAVALALTIHLVGDIHQPLHCAANYYKPKPLDWPYDDAGGNAVKVTNFDDLYPNLHEFWDEAYKIKFDATTQRFHAEPDGDPCAVTISSQKLIDLEAEVLKEMPATPVTLAGEYYKAWALETHQLGSAEAYGKMPNHSTKSVTIGKDYADNAMKIARRQMCLAGLRLAAILNKLYP